MVFFLRVEIELFLEDAVGTQKGVYIASHYEVVIGIFFLQFEQVIFHELELFFVFIGLRAQVGVYDDVVVCYNDGGIFGPSQLL